VHPGHTQLRASRPSVKKLTYLVSYGCWSKFATSLVRILQITNISCTNSLTALRILVMYLKPEFTALLQNNDVPSESTILEVTESLKAPLNELQEVEAKIQRFSELLQKLKMKRKRIQKIINDHHIILSPARRLPPDVLHEIFFHCLPTRHNPIVKYSESPLLLTRICSSWRAIALSSPQLWSKIHIPLPGDPSVSESNSGIIRDETRLNDRLQRYASVMRSRCHAVRSWLSRSGACPLSLSVIYPGDYSDTQNSKNDELIQEMFDILLSSADRWSDVLLSMPEDIYNKLQGDINPTMFSSLKSLKITLRINFHRDTDSTPIRLLAAPSLRRITFGGIQRVLSMVMTGNIGYQPIWNHITHIAFASSTTDRSLFVLLRQCPNLVMGKFRVHDSDQSNEPSVDREQILLPRLESLEINDCGLHEIMAVLFNAIKAPALTRLSYQGFDERDPEDNSAIPLPIPVLPLLENSTLISDLSLDGRPSSQDIQECLQRGAQVTHLAFGRPPSANASREYPDEVLPDVFDLRLLSISSLDVSPLPKLESLEAHQLSSLTDEELLEVISGRINASKRGKTAALKSVKVSFQRQRQKDITENVYQLAEEAEIEMELDLTYLPKELKFLKRLSPSFGLTSSSNDIYAF